MHFIWNVSKSVPIGLYRVRPTGRFGFWRYPGRRFAKLDSLSLSNPVGFAGLEPVAHPVSKPVFIDGCEQVVDSNPCGAFTRNSGFAKRGAVIMSC